LLTYRNSKSIVIFSSVLQIIFGQFELFWYFSPDYELTSSLTPNNHTKLTMFILILFLGIALLLFFIMGLKLNAFLSLVIVSFLVGAGMGMPVDAILKSAQKGIGDTLGSLTMILGFGVMLGKLLSETGAVQQISARLIDLFGIKGIRIAMALTGFIIGIALFYNAGFILLLPLVFTVAQQSKIPVMQIGIPVAAALSVTHGFLPPHPGPAAIAVLFKADAGKVLIYGIIVAIPAIVLGGLVLPRFLKNLVAKPSEKLFNTTWNPERPLPKFSLSLLVALIPIILMAVATIADLCFKSNGKLFRFLSSIGLPLAESRLGYYCFQDNESFYKILKFIGDPGVALLIAVLAALLLLRRGQTVASLMDRVADSVESVAMILLIIAGGGAFKQVLTDSGIGAQLAALMQNTPLSPLLLGWLIATLIRISLGSATLAGLTAAGIMQPLLATMSFSPELMVLAIGAGSLMCSHVNDTGFWMFKEYFGLTIGQTLRSWTVMESIIGTVGLVMVLILSYFV
jgi:gluconate transporter